MSDKSTPPNIKEAAHLSEAALCDLRMRYVEVAGGEKRVVRP